MNDTSEYLPETGVTASRDPVTADFENLLIPLDGGKIGDVLFGSDFSMIHCTIEIYYCIHEFN